MLFIEDLLQKAFNSDKTSEATSLIIISGYASPAMVQQLVDVRQDLQITLAIGMTSKDGISLIHHRGFCKLASEYDKFQCKYNQNSPPIHSKIYLWMDASNTPVYALLGSANFTTTGILGEQREILYECNPVEAFQYITAIYNEDTFVDCMLPDIESRVRINQVQLATASPQRLRKLHQKFAAEEALPHVCLSFLNTKGQMYNPGGGINWGIRDARDSNEAYIHIPAKIVKQKFFPPRNVTFNVLINGTRLVRMTTNQDGGKALTTVDNSELGAIVRQTFGLESGCLVKASNLKKRTNVYIYKLDDENYYMQF